MIIRFMGKKAWHLYSPILFFLIYLYFTVFLFEFGPWPWPVENKFELYCYLNAYHIALYLGFKNGLKKYYKWTFIYDYNNYKKVQIVSKIILISSLANILFFFPTLLARTGGLILDLSFDIGGLYNKSQESRSIVGVEYARIFFGPLLFLTFPLTCYFWGNLTKSKKILGFVAVLLTILIYFSMGTNNAIANILITAPWLIYSAYLAGKIRISKRLCYSLSVVTVGLMFAFFVFFAQGQATREGSTSFYGYFPAVGISADYDNFLIRNFPPLYATGIIGITSYLSGGYYAMSLTFDKDYTPTFGLGNSMFIALNLDEMFDLDIIKSTYPGKISEEDGWNLFRLWSSIYPWLASDFSYIGIIFIMYLIGLLTSICWQDLLAGSSIFAIPAFVKLAIFIYYIPANNQCVQSGEDFFSFYIIILLWLVTRNAYKKNQFIL